MYGGLSAKGLRFNRLLPARMPSALVRSHKTKTRQTPSILPLSSFLTPLNAYAGFSQQTFFPLSPHIVYHVTTHCFPCHNTLFLLSPHIFSLVATHCFPCHHSLLPCLPKTITSSLPNLFICFPSSL